MACFRAYEELKPLVLFGGSAAEQAQQTGTPERTMYHRIERFPDDDLTRSRCVRHATAHVVVWLPGLGGVHGREVAMGEIGGYTHQNRHAWNEVARARQRKMRPPGFFASGGYNFRGRELETLGDVSGLAVLHAPCASGEDTLSFAVNGARPTGVDISDGAIAIARDKAERAGLGARFVCADILAPPPDLQAGTFDLVYASAGALCWLPDIGRWAKIIAAALKPGGRLILCEHHPLFFDTLDVSSGRVEIGGDYFRRGTPTRDEGGLGHLACGAETTEHYYVFTWPLGDVVTAVIQAGMRLERLEEFPYEDSQYHTDLSEEFRAELRRLPVEFHLVARKE